MNPNSAITSTHNEKIKLVRELLSSKKSRVENGLFIIEGVRMAEEAIAAGSSPALALYSRQVSQDGLRIVEELRQLTPSVEEVSSELLNRISDTRHSQGILLALPLPKNPSPRGTYVKLALALDNIRDPGNMGATLRSAAAFGFEMVFMTAGCTDPFAPKVVRAGMGAHFKLNLFEMSASDITSFCKNINQPSLKILLADATNGQICWESDLAIPLCLIIGSEAEGATGDLRGIADGIVKIPMQPHTESLNAAVSASILMYEVQRQRKIK